MTEIIDLSLARKRKAIRRVQYTHRYNIRLKKVANDNTKYPGVAYGMDKNHNYADNDTEIVFYRKVYKSSHTDRYKYNKNQSNRAIRRYNKRYIENNEDKLICKGGTYKKIFDFKWNVD